MTTERDCAYCGTPFQRGAKALYCSDRCRHKAARAAKIADGREATQLAQMRASRATRPKRAAQCVTCGAKFVAHNAASRFCSLPCRRRWNNRQVGIGCAIPDCPKPHRARGLCAFHYKEQRAAEGYVAPVAKWTDARRDAYHRRRAAKRRSVTGEPVVFSEIAERDRWTCHICALPVDPTRAWPDRMSPSLDHVQPLARGGKHDPSNVQLAHLSCNSRKGAA